MNPAKSSASRSRARRITITQPYVPAYRVPLWEAVFARLADAGFESRVFWGLSDREFNTVSARGDLETPDWATRVPIRTLPTTPRTPRIVLRRLPVGWRQGSLLVTEMQAANGNGWQAVATRRPFVTLGHGVSETTTRNWLADRLENSLNRRAAHVLTYTEAGKRAVVHMSDIAADRVTSFNNTTDTVQLRREIESVTSESIDIFRANHRIPQTAKVALYLGSLETYKHIDLLIRATREVFSRSEDWWLVVAGDGALRGEVERLRDESGRVVMLGRVGPNGFAPAARIARLLVNPGRVGLVAVDALTMHLPLLTTTAAAHAPEFEYLQDDTDVLITDPNPNAYADAWMKLAVGHRTSTTTPPSAERSGEIIAGCLIRASLDAADRPLLSR